MKNFKLIPLLALAAALFSAAPRAHAQTILLPTTLSAAIADSRTHTMVVTSATGFVANTTVAIIDDEEVAVEAVSGTTITVRRGAGGTIAAPHVNGALVFVGPALAFSPPSPARLDLRGDPTGACTRSGQPYLPFISFRSSTISDCLGGTWQAGSPNSGTTLSTRFRVAAPESGGTAYTALGGTGTAVGATTLYCTEVILPSNKLLTGIAVLNGTTVTANARYVILYDSAGNALANSALAGQASVSASVFETYAFTAKYFAIGGPTQYFACLQDNAVGGTTVRMVTTGTQDTVLTKGQTGATFGTIPALTVPTTFTTAVGPYVYLY